MSVTAVPIRPVKKGSVLKLWIGLGLLALAAVGLAFTGTSGHKWLKTASGLEYRVIEAGEGPSPKVSDVVTFEYEGRLENGEVFDSSEGKGPAQIPVFGVVPGFSEGLQLMQKGGTYALRLPPELGYGPQGQPPAIPPNSTIEFEVKLVDFRPLTMQEIQQLQMMQQQQGSAPQGR